MEASGYRYPADDGSVDFVLAKSVFTHLLEREARHYLGEIGRVLRTGRAAVVTAFLLDDDGAASGEFSHGGPDVWHSVKERPEAQLAYRRSRFVEMVEAANLRVEKIIDGHWRGRRIAPTFQDIVVLR